MTAPVIMIVMFRRHPLVKLVIACMIVPFVKASLTTTVIGRVFLTATPFAVMVIATATKPAIRVQEIVETVHLHHPVPELVAPAVRLPTNPVTAPYRCRSVLRVACRRPRPRPRPRPRIALMITDRIVLAVAHPLLTGESVIRSTLTATGKDSVPRRFVSPVPL
jgi:hypothetical protein